MSTSSSDGRDGDAGDAASARVVSYSIDSERRRVLVYAAGVLTRRALDVVREQLSKEPTFDPTFDQLFDLSGATNIAIPSGEMESVASVSAFQTGVRRAFVCTTDMQYGMARMFSAMVESYGHTARVFRNLAEAEEWLESPRG
ncbi:MAG TPA: hypothetical protein VGM50_13635 [Gemmatimonadaceae bacterium]|jgi:hypothetical protein